MTLPQYGSPNFLESTFAVIPRIPRQHATKDSQGSTPTRIYLRFRQRQEVSQSKWGPEANGCSLWNLTLWPISYLGFAWSHKVTTFSIFLPLWPDIHQITRPALGLQPKDQNGALFERRQRTHTWGAQWLSGIAALKRHTPCWLGRLPWRLHGNLQDCFGSLDLWDFWDQPTFSRFQCFWEVSPYWYRVSPLFSSEKISAETAWTFRILRKSMWDELSKKVHTGGFTDLSIGLLVWVPI